MDKESGRGKRRLFFGSIIYKAMFLIFIHACLCGCFLEDLWAAGVYKKAYYVALREDLEDPNHDNDTTPKDTENSDPMYLFSGEYYLEETDMEVPGRGDLPFRWMRKYRSRIGPDTVQGNGWDYGYHKFIADIEGIFTYFDGNTRVDFYNIWDETCWVCDGFFQTLCEQPDGTFLMTFADGKTYTFAPLDGAPEEGKITGMMDRNGNALSFHYDGSGRLVSVIDTLSRTYTISYNTDGYIESVSDFAGRQVLYDYYQDTDPDGSAGDLRSVRSPAVVTTTDFPVPAEDGHQFPNGKVWIYTYTKGLPDISAIHPQILPSKSLYSLNHNLQTIRDGNGDIYIRITYADQEWPRPDLTTEALDRVVRLEYGIGQFFDYSYHKLTPGWENNYADSLTIVNNRKGYVRHLYYNEMNELVLYREYTGQADPQQRTTLYTNRPQGKLRPDDPDYFETRYEYNYDSLPTVIIYPDQSEQHFSYDEDQYWLNPRSRGNMLSRGLSPGPLGGDQSYLIEYFTYETTYNQVETHQDFNGNTTTHEYDTHGNLTHVQHPTVTQGVLGGGSQVSHENWEYSTYGQITARIWPDNGSGHRRRDEFTYYDSGPQNGYLKEKIVDAGNLDLTTTYQHNLVGQVISVTDPRGHDTQFIVNQLDQVVRETSRQVSDTLTVRYQRDIFYDGNNNVIREEMDNYDDQGQIQENARITTLYEYDILDRLVRVEEEVYKDDNRAEVAAKEGMPGGIHTVATEYAYDPNGNLSLISFGEATKGSDPFNLVRKQYDERDLIFKVIRAEGHTGQSTTQYDYNGNEKLVEISEGLESAPRIHQLFYDGYNRLWGSGSGPAYEDPEGNTLRINYDANGNITSLRIDGELVEGESGSNVRLYEAAMAYDQMSRMYQREVSFFDTATGSPLGGDGFSTTKIFRNANSQLLRLENDNGHFIDVIYDTANRRSLVTDTKGNTTLLEYDDNSNLLSRQETAKSDLGGPDQVFLTSFVYDNLDRLISRTDNKGNTTQYAYNSLNNRTRIDDPLGRIVCLEYDGMSRLSRVIRDMNGNGADASDPADIILSQSWDDSSRLVGQTDDNGNTTTYSYDALNRLVFLTQADDTVYTASYDVHGNRVSLQDPNGSTASLTYDLLNRPVGVSVSRGTNVQGTTSETYKYDGLSRIVYAEDDDSLVELAYDSLSNLIRETQYHGVPPFLNGQEVVSAYDGAGNRLTCTYPGGRVVTGTFDALERLSTISDQGGLIVSYDYVGSDRVEQRDYGNGTRLEFEYDGITGIPNPPNDFGVRRIIRTKHSVISGGALIDDRSYTWDQAYNKTSRTDSLSGITHTYGYDEADRLLHAIVTDGMKAVLRDTTYNQDGVHNRMSVAGNPDTGDYVGGYVMTPGAPLYDFEMNQYSVLPLESRQYDENGNLVQRTGAAGNADIFYDFRNQMVEYRDLLLGERHTYAYDCFRRRIGKVVDADGSGVQTRYIYAGWQVCEEQDDAGVTQASFVYGNGIDEILTMRRGAADSYFHADDLGNVMKLTDGAGTVIESYDYEDYGRPLDGDTLVPIAGSSQGNPYLFNGRRYDPETGWYYYRTRYLDPTAGRFTTQDTIGIWGDPAEFGNAYSFVGNNPWTWLDPYGLWARDEQGNIKFKGDGKGSRRDLEFRVDSPDSNQGKNYYQERTLGTIQTDSGSEINVSRWDDGDKGFQTNCIGYAFADGKFWINPEETANIIKGEGYVRIDPNAEEVKVGDVIVYYDDNGKVVHAAIVTGVDPETGEITEVEGMNGVNDNTTKSSPDPGTKDTDTEVYRKPKSQKKKTEKSEKKCSNK